MPTTDQAICLRVSDYSETSQVVTLLTRQGGVVRLLAKGSRRARSKTGGGLDLLGEGACVYAGAGKEGLGAMTEFAETSARGRLRGSLDRLHPALYMLELCGAALGENDPHPDVFDLLHGALERLGQEDASPPAVLAYFQWRLGQCVGLLGQMGACVSCRRRPGPRGTYFSSGAGGLLCRDCETGADEKQAVSSAALAGLAALAAASAGKRVRLPDRQARDVNVLLAYHFQYQLGRRLMTADLATKTPPRAG